MKILGVTLGHDSSACMVEDGKVTRYVAEERYNRIKAGVSNAIHSVSYCLDNATMDALDGVAISGGYKNGTSTNSHYQLLFKRDSTGGVPICVRQYGHEYSKVVEVDHHLCHAASAYFTSGFEKSLIITIDGIGEEVTHTVYEADGKTMRALYFIKSDSISKRGEDGVFREHRFQGQKIYSLGWFYGMATEALGWRPVCDEGKTMGLAPYGDPTKIPEPELRRKMYEVFPVGYYHNDGKTYYHFGGADALRDMADKYGREHLAAAVQKKLEDRVINMVRYWMKRTGHKNLCTAGGVFLNVKLNQRIVAECAMENYWPFPIAGDAGISIGAAMIEYHKKSRAPYTPWRMPHLYYGPEYGNEEIEKILIRNKLTYSPYSTERVAQALASNRTVGWFQGRMEGGPRALGGRSILMSPLHAENKDILNHYVKFREPFRPFCPSVIAEEASKYFDGGGEFMITAANVLTNCIPGVTHVDGTARPQIVHADKNPRFHALIKAFGNITGHAVLLNTSLNIMGEPIVRSPEEAIRCFYGAGLEMLVMGDFIIEKGRV